MAAVPELVAQLAGAWDSLQHVDTSGSRLQLQRADDLLSQRRGNNAGRPRSSAVAHRNDKGSRASAPSSEVRALAFLLRLEWTYRQEAAARLRVQLLCTRAWFSLSSAARECPRLVLFGIPRLCIVRSLACAFCLVGFAFVLASQPTVRMSPLRSWRVRCGALEPAVILLQDALSAMVSNDGSGALPRSMDGVPLPEDTAAAVPGGSLVSGGVEDGAVAAARSADGAEAALSDGRRMEDVEPLWRARYSALVRHHLTLTRCAVAFRAVGASPSVSSPLPAAHKSVAVEGARGESGGLLGVPAPARRRRSGGDSRRGSASCEPARLDSLLLRCVSALAGAQTALRATGLAQAHPHVVHCAESLRCAQGWLSQWHGGVRGAWLQHQSDAQPLPPVLRSWSVQAEAEALGRVCDVFAHLSHTPPLLSALRWRQAANASER